ncbi:hypothetical protein EB796_000707 [Bugula neritina]|uniref:Uncharacterized protein n=1 Tax=Bugula neritina TaxID=10212 RepID=A0A7J7KS17_BUGNE|nr:hypothetical protein EB796_000707 [Bugula neritina]
MIFHCRIDGGKQIYLQEEKKCFKQEKLTFHREVDKIGLTYNHEKQFYIESSEFTGELKCYKSTIPKRSRCLYIKRVRF